MRIPAILHKCNLLGMERIGITDHLNTLDQLPIHRQIKEQLAQESPKLEVYFGVELNFMGLDQGFAYSEQVRDELGYEFAIGGIHSAYGYQRDKDKCLAIQHRHHMKVMEDPSVMYWSIRIGSATPNLSRWTGLWTCLSSLIPGSGNWAQLLPRQALP